MTFKALQDDRDDDGQPSVVCFTHGEWRRLLEDRSFLEDEANRFQPPRRYQGRPVVIIPAPSTRA